SARLFLLRRGLRSAPPVATQESGGVLQDRDDQTWVRGAASMSLRGQAGCRDHCPEDFRMADVAVRAAERRLDRVDHSVGVKGVELSRGEAVWLASLDQRCDGGGGCLLVAVVAHRAPAVGQVVGGLTVLTRQCARGGIPP